MGAYREEGRPPAALMPRILSLKYNHVMRVITINQFTAKKMRSLRRDRQQPTNYVSLFSPHATLDHPGGEPSGLICCSGFGIWFPASLASNAGCIYAFI